MRIDGRENVVNALMGIWFIIAPPVLGFSNDHVMTWSSVISGLILLVLTGSAALNETARRQRWIQYVDALVGIWFIVAPGDCPSRDRRAISTRS